MLFLSLLSAFTIVCSSIFGGLRTEILVQDRSIEMLYKWIDNNNFLYKKKNNYFLYNVDTKKVKKISKIDFESLYYYAGKIIGVQNEECFPIESIQSLGLNWAISPDRKYAVKIHLDSLRIKHPTGEQDNYALPQGFGIYHGNRADILFGNDSNIFAILELAGSEFDSSTSRPNYQERIWLFDLTKRQYLRLCVPGKRSPNLSYVDAVWSSKGDKIAFTVIDDNHYETWLYYVESRKYILLFSSENYEKFPNILEGAFTHDDKKLVYSTTDGIFVYSMDTGESKIIYELSEIYKQNHWPIWSPDGKKIVFLLQDEHAVDKIILINFVDHYK